MPQQLYTGGQCLKYLLFRRLGRPHSWSGCFGEKKKSLSLLGNE